MNTTENISLNEYAAWFIVIVLFSGGFLDFWLATTGRPTITSVTRVWGDAFPLMRWVGLGLAYHLFIGR